MFRLFRVSVSIFLALTDQPINLIYRALTRILTSSTGPRSNELLRPGTADSCTGSSCAGTVIMKVTGLLVHAAAAAAAVAVFLCFNDSSHVEKLGLQLVIPGAVFILWVVKWFWFRRKRISSKNNRIISSPLIKHNSSSLRDVYRLQ